MVRFMLNHIHLGMRSIAWLLLIVLEIGGFFFFLVLNSFVLLSNCHTSL